MIKILTIMTDATLGGAGRVLLQTLRCLDRDRFEMIVAVPSGSALVSLVEELGYRVIETQKGHDRSWEQGAVAEYKKIIRREKPDIVHTHSSLAGKVAAWLMGVPVRIYTRHSAFDIPKKDTVFPRKQISGLINNTLSTAIVAVAHVARDNLVVTGVDPKRIEVIINGVEPVKQLNEVEKAQFRASLNIEKEDLVCLLSARMEPYKGHSYLLETAKKLEGKPVKFIMMGDGSCREELEKQARELGIEEMVRFTGFVLDVVPYCNICDVNLNCSHGAEASSIALAEGMSLGKPAVVTDSGGNPYMITDGVNGLVVPQRDADAMADAILKLLEDRALFEKLSAGALKEYGEKFNARAMTAQLEELYLRQMQEKGKRV